MMLRYFVGRVVPRNYSTIDVVQYSPVIPLLGRRVEAYQSGGISCSKGISARSSPGYVSLSGNGNAQEKDGLAFD